MKPPPLIEDELHDLLTSRASIANAKELAEVLLAAKHLQPSEREPYLVQIIRELEVVDALLMRRYGLPELRPSSGL